jgi:hypothetical protein
MNMLATIGGQAELLRQAANCRKMGAPFVAALLEAGYRQLFHAPETQLMMAGWSEDPAASALAMRFNGALHALARRGSIAPLAALFRGEHDDFDGAVAAALQARDGFIAEWIRHPTQTNEVARSAAIHAALMVAGQRFAMPFELLEIGASCGLHLNLHRYAYQLGSVPTGDRDSTVRIAPQWRGAPPPDVDVAIRRSRGVDLHPLQAKREADRERLLSFVWADQPQRAERLEAALRIAVDHPPQVDEEDAVSWANRRLAVPQEAGCCRVILHSMFLQYLDRAHRDTLLAVVRAAGERATPIRPFAWISFEWTAKRREVHLSLTTWPTGETELLAVCHPYGDWLDWRAP